METFKGKCPLSFCVKRFSRLEKGTLSTLYDIQKKRSDEGKWAKRKWDFEKENYIRCRDKFIRTKSVDWV